MNTDRLFDRTPVSRTFVNRELQIRVFEDAVFSVPSDSSDIIAFYGPGGQGKTQLLLRIAGMFQNQVDPTYGFVRCARMSLMGMSSDNAEQFLISARNAFAEVGVSTPGFDLTLALVWERWRPGQRLPELAKSSAWIGRGRTAADLSLDSVADAVSGWINSNVASEAITSVVGAVPGVGPIAKLLGGWLIEKGKRHWVERSCQYLHVLFDKEDLKPQAEIFETLLCWILAQDLNSHVETSKDKKLRLALLIDEYERTLDEGGGGAKWRTNLIERQLQVLLNETIGMLVAIFGRERLKWKGSWEVRLRGKQHSLSGLKRKDAQIFLKAVPIHDEEVIAAIIEGAREEDSDVSLVYPLMLNLQVEHWSILSATGRKVNAADFLLRSTFFQERCQELVRRLLRDYGSDTQKLLERLAFCERFDEPLYRFLCLHFKLPQLENSYAKIAALSIFSQDDFGFYRMHKVVADAVGEIVTPSFAVETTASIFDYYTQQTYVENNHRFRQRHISSLQEALIYTTHLSTEEIVDWLLKYTNVLAHSHYMSEGAQIWRLIYHRCLSELGDTNRRTRASGFTYAEFLLGLGAAEEAGETIDRLVATGGPPSTLAIANLIWFSPTANAAQRWIEDFKARIASARAPVPEALRQRAFAAYLQKQRDLKSAMTAFEEIESFGATPHAVFYNILIELSASFDGTIAILEMMKNSKVTPSDHTYALALLFCNDLQERQTIDSALRYFNLQLGVIHYNIMIDKSKDFHSARRVLSTMKSRGVTPNIITFTTLIKKCDNSIDSREIFDDIISMNIIPDEVTFYFLIKNETTYADCISLLRKMARYSLRPSKEIFALVSRRITNLNELRSFVTELQSEEFLINSHIIVPAVREIIRASPADEWNAKLNELISFLKDISIDLDAFFFTQISNVAPTSALISELIDQCLEKGITPDNGVIARAITLTSDGGDAQRTFDEFIRKGITPSTMMVNELVHKKGYDDGDQILSILNSLNCQPNSLTYSYIMLACSTWKERIVWASRMISAGLAVKDAISSIIAKGVDNLEDAMACGDNLRQLGAELGQSYFSTIAKILAQTLDAEEFFAWHRNEASRYIEPIAAAIKALADSGAIAKSFDLAIKYPFLPAARAFFRKFPEESYSLLQTRQSTDEPFQNTYALAYWSLAQEDYEAAFDWLSAALSYTEDPVVSEDIRTELGRIRPDSLNDSF
ncbi:pentatricopeptide repeat-containing protein [Rhizobium terrae]|uniref:pentatricopeptide repeat-containing protein n=1 Tax=Rhizobium terrae TaxID=2171756 RepID=UPI000E3D8EAE|nr:pentatricopeptide repeat-containing protein [Rhizobium terrae]